MGTKRSNLVAIIPAAGAPSNIIPGHTGMADTMLPINGKPVIGHIIDDLIRRNVGSVIIAIREHDDLVERYVALKYANRIRATFVSIPSGTSLVYTISAAAKHIKSASGVLIYLGDTIYKGPLSFKEDFLVVSQDVVDSSKWCIVEKYSDGKLAFVDKPIAYEGTGAALCGIYYLHNAKAFLTVLKRIKTRAVHISDILTAYQKHWQFKLVTAQKWYDCGNIENYHRARIDFLRSRNFNGLEYNAVEGIITKRSKKREKMLDESHWYQALPDSLKIFAPRMLAVHKEKATVAYELEFYGYPSLADLYTFGDEGAPLWNLIINRLLDIHAVFRRFNRKVSYRAYYDMYVTKTIERLQELEKVSYWRRIFRYDQLIVNGESLKNIGSLAERLPGLVRTLYKESPEDMAVIHGDLCLSNILCDVNNLLVKFIDPRGSFGTRSIYGDQKYDLAKLRHSFHGNYDFIIADLFSLKESGSSFDFKVHTDLKHEEIAARFDQALCQRNINVGHIALIEGLLFLSMIPLHAENPTRQKAMYLTGIRILQPYL